MKKITIYDDEDYGLTVQQGDHYMPCRNKTDVLNWVGDCLNEQEKEEAPCQAE